MKICSSCGASVADNVDICPDCGMEFDASLTPVPASNSAAVPGAGAGNNSGFTVDFGSNSGAEPAPATPAAETAPASDFDSNDFGIPPRGTLQLDKSEPEPALPTPIAPAPAALPPVTTAKLALKRGGVLSGDTFTFGPGSIIGRFDPESGPVDVDLAILPEASYVSRHHAEFRYDAGNNTWFVKDMGSSNGTFWRAGGQGAFSRLASEQALQTGDEISLGNARFEFQSF